MLFIISAVLCLAQIVRTYMGMTLGVTTRAQAKTILQNKGYFVQTEGDCLSVFHEDIKFGGILWDRIVLQFYNNKLSKFILSRFLKDYQELVNDVNQLDQGLVQKYKNYMKDNQKDDNGFTRTYSDTKTGIVIAFQGNNGKPTFSLGYLDDRLLKLGQRSNNSGN